MKRLLPALLLCSCSVNPTVVPTKDGKYIATGGWSFLEQSDRELAVITLPDGVRIEYAKDKKDQTRIADTYIKGKTLVDLADIANGGEAIREKGETARQVSSDGVKKAQIDGDVKIKTFVPPEP